MTNNDPKRESGYRGALPAREDRLARPWLFIVAGILVLVLVLSVAGIPSRLIPEPTPVPLPSIPAPTGSVSAEPSASASVEQSASPEASPSGE
jgi:hypothetical protein